MTTEKWEDTGSGGQVLAGRGFVFLNGCADWQWRVYWGGYVAKSGTGCVTRSEAKREVEYWLGEIDAGRLDPPWKKSKERQDLEERLLAARAKGDTDPKPWGFLP